MEAELALRTTVPPNSSPHLDSAISRYAGLEAVFVALPDAGPSRPRPAL